MEFAEGSDDGTLRVPSLPDLITRNSETISVLIDVPIIGQSLIMRNKLDYCNFYIYS